MKKMHFNKIFVITVTACSIPMFAFIRYISGDQLFTTTGMGNAVLTAVVISLLPALLISIWWWNHQHQDEMDD